MGEWEHPPNRRVENAKLSKLCVKSDVQAPWYICVLTYSPKVSSDMSRWAYSCSPNHTLSLQASFSFLQNIYTRTIIIYNAHMYLLLHVKVSKYLNNPAGSSIPGRPV